ncbi:MAG: sulfotransferase [Deltaproteobacteria bacterium]|nr:sulfotransferase [Deltaproteobacteria bacterium]
MCNLAFIIGSARSGTTILGELLDCHPDIMQWYEPYYLWRKYFLCKDSEVWKPNELNEKVKRIVQEEHKIFQKKSGKKVVVEKMPSHSFNIELILRVFPKAKWIHIIRDGRDITLSMKKEWNKRKEIIENKDYFRSFRAGLNVIKRAPFLRYKLKLMFYELNSNLSLKPSRYLNKAKWKGQIGWGARFNEWEKFIEKLTPLQFNAMQWVETVRAAHDGWPMIDNDKKLEVNYENLMQDPQHTLTTILNFIGLDYKTDFYQRTPKLKKNNFNKWKTELAEEEIKQIKPILSPMLEKLGYTQQQPW